MSKASGWPLERTWKPVRSGKPELPLHQKAKVLSQLGAITWKLSQLRFSEIGSLFEEQGIFKIKECLSRGHVLHQRYSLEDVPRGPFPSEMPFYDSLVTAFMQHAEILRLSHHCFVAPVPCRGEYQSDHEYHEACDLWNDFVKVGHKIDSSDNRLDFIIAGSALQDIIRHWRLKLPKAVPESFPLCHSDLSVNNVYVDDDYNITCIIDWEFSSSVPEAMLLIPPGLPQSRDELSQDLVVAFKLGFWASISSTPRVIETIRASDLLQHSRLPWLLTRFLNFDSIHDYDLFATIWRMTYGAEKDMKAYFADQRSSPRYIQHYNEVQLEDEPVQKTEKAERKYFRDDIRRRSIARKLTLVSQWKSQYVPTNYKPLRKNGELFVADAKLWKWILDVRQEWEGMS